MQFIENRTFDEIAVGDIASLTRTLRPEDIQLFAVMSGDVNPMHLDADYAKKSRFQEIIGHGMWGGSLISTVLGTQYPGPGTIYLNQTLRFHRPVNVGDTLTVTVKVVEKNEQNQRLTLECACVNQNGDTVISGKAEVLAPTEKLARPWPTLPGIRFVAKTGRFEQLVEQVRTLKPLTVAAVHPCSATALLAVMEPARVKIVTPILVGPEPRIRSAAAEAKVDLSAFRIVNAPHSHAAAAQAAALVREGEAGALMQGSQDPREFLQSIVSGTAGLRTGRRMSHVYVIDTPTYARLLFITDAALNIAPDLTQKRDIVQNAIDLARTVGIAVPKVAVLAAVEKVTQHLRSTTEAAALTKMNELGQIRDGIVDGPISVDNALSPNPALSEQSRSPVAGRADILLAPDMESGNLLAKQLQSLSEAQTAGLLLGARVPIVITGPRDTALSSVVACALARLLMHEQGTGLPSEASPP